MNDQQSQPDVAMRHCVRAPGRGFAPGPTAGAGPTSAIAALNDVLAALRMTELRCEREYLMARHLRCPPLAAAALEHAHDVCAHSAAIGVRIRGLGGAVRPPPDASLDAVPAARDGRDVLRAVIAADLAAMRATVDQYREIAAAIARHDPASYRLLDNLISGEIARTEELAELPARVAPRAAH